MRLLERTIEEAKNQPNRVANLRAIMANVNRQLSLVKAKLYKQRQSMITDVLKQVDVVGSRIDHHSQIY
jgi:hypothetical protein